MVDFIFFQGVLTGFSLYLLSNRSSHPNKRMPLQSGTHTKQQRFTLLTSRFLNHAIMNNEY
jgi:hypothetical protein